MRKKLKSFTLVASTVASLAIILIACGKGELTNYFEADLNLSVEDFKGKCAGNAKLDSICGGDFTSYTPPPSSAAPQSSGGGTSSQGGGTSSQGGGTSSQGGGTSSQGGGTSSQGGGTSSAAPPVTQSSSSQAAQQGCPTGTEKPGYDCSWDYKGTALTPGTVIKPEKTGDDAGCTTKWLFKTGTSPLLKCQEVPSAGVTTEGSRAYILYATLECGGTSYVNNCKPTDGLSTNVAPELTGSCKWAKNPTTTARGGSPSGVSVTDTDNLCAGKTVKYVYETADGLKDWPETGILTEWKSWDKKHTETYNVKATFANCPKYTIPTYSDCPPLEVSAGTDYIIECTGGINDGECGGKAKKEATLKLEECVEINVNGYTDQHYLPTMIMRCNAEGAQASISLTLSLNGNAQKCIANVNGTEVITNPPCTGSYSWNGEITLGTIKLGDNSLGTLCLTTMSGATGVKCQLGNK